MIKKMILKKPYLISIKLFNVILNLLMLIIVEDCFIKIKRKIHKKLFLITIKLFNLILSMQMLI
jgi:hypothetical protein